MVLSLVHNMVHAHDADSTQTLITPCTFASGIKQSVLSVVVGKCDQTVEIGEKLLINDRLSPRALQIHEILPLYRPRLSTTPSSTMC